MNSAELAPLLRTLGQGIAVPCWIQPRASRTAIAGIHGDALKIALAAPPVDGKANEELCKFFSKTLDLSKGAVELVSGKTSRKKLILIKTITLQQFLERICNE